MKTVAVNVKRFRVFDIEEQKMIGKFDTLKDAVKLLTPFWIKANAKGSEGGNPYLDFMVDDCHDDIEVNWHELMTEWDEGERPLDLQMF